jgi:hypothetical protein
MESRAGSVDPKVFEDFSVSYSNAENIALMLAEPGLVA